MVRGAWWIAGLGLAALTAHALEAGQPSELEAVKSRGRLVVVSFPHQDSEFISVNLERGPMRKVGGVEDFKGLDVDLMAAFAHSLGVALEIRPIARPGYGELIPTLLGGDGNIIASSFTITPARLEQVDFSSAYFESPELVVVRKDAPVATVNELAGTRGAAVRGAAQVDLLRRLGVPDQAMVLSEFTRDNYDAVAAGRADFTIVDGGSINLVLDDFPNLRVAFPVGEGVKYGFAVRKGSDLLPPLNALLARLQGSGELDELRTKWIRPKSR